MSDLVLSCLFWYCLVWSSSVLFDLFVSVIIWFCLICSGIVLPDLVLSCLIWNGLEMVLSIIILSDKESSRTGMILSGLSHLIDHCLIWYCAFLSYMVLPCVKMNWILIWYLLISGPSNWTFSGIVLNSLHGNLVWSFFLEPF